MVIDKISAKAVETLLSITFGDRTLNYEMVAKNGIHFEGIKDIEMNFDTDRKKVHGPFSTVASRLALSEEVGISEKVVKVTNHVKEKGVFAFFKGLLKTNEELSKLSENAEKCISDELVKSQKLLDSNEFENPSLILLMKGMKNLENPEKVNGLSPASVQEVGALQIGMAVNHMKSNTPKLFSFNLYDSRNFKRALIELSKTSFVEKCCDNAFKQEDRILELTVAANKDTQYDAFLHNGKVDYSTSFKDIDELERDGKIRNIKSEVSRRNGKQKPF